MADAAGKQAHPHDAVTDDHHRGKHRIAREAGLLGARAQHHGDDQRHLDHRHGDGEHQRAERLAHAMRDDFRMVDAREDRARERGADEREQDEQKRCDG